MAKLLEIQVGKYMTHCNQNKWELGVYNEILNEDTYQLLSLFKNNFVPKNVFDIGTHIGIFTVVCANVWPNAEFTCFEPQLSNFKLLQFNTKDIVNINLNNCALIASDDITGFMDITNADIDNTGGIEVSLIPSSNTVAITCKHIKNFLPPTIDLMKMDCESGEKYLMPYLKSIEYCKNIKVLVGEYHNGLEYIFDDTLSDTHHITKYPNPYLPPKTNGTVFAIRKDVVLV